MMASRRAAREFALQALYQADIAETDPVAALESLWQGLVDGEGVDGLSPPDAEQTAFAERLVRGVAGGRAAIDELIESCSTNWRVRRMPAVDRNVLRLAAYELSECKDIPATVSMNEAIELAKRFGTADSRAFVNGIVDRMARQLGRQDRDGGRKKPRPPR